LRVGSSRYTRAASPSELKFSIAIRDQTGQPSSHSGASIGGDRQLAADRSACVSPGTFDNNDQCRGVAQIDFNDPIRLTICQEQDKGSPTVNSWDLTGPAD
jgi:hypothetical protein